MNRTIWIFAIAGIVAACGGDDPAATAGLPPAALEGRDVVRSSGCAACHGPDGQGGVGPAFVGLFGSEVDLQDHGSVVADREYIVESIVDPGAEVVEGYDLPMPRTELSAGEIDAVVAYIEALAEVTP